MKRALVIDDPVFGKISFDEPFWVFTPGPGPSAFTILIEAPCSGPTDVQRQFFQQVVANLADFSRRCLAFIELSADPPVDMRSLSVYSVTVGSDDDCRCTTFVLEFSDEAADNVHRVQIEEGQPSPMDATTR